MRALRRLGFALALPLGLSLGAGCESFEIGGAKHVNLTYTDDAKAAYGEAMEAYKNKEWENAKALFGEIRRLFNYSRYARLAELRLADVSFEQEKYSEAITAYREFAQSHKNDPDSEYARYRMCKALFLDIDDTIMLPPAEERDQATTLEAEKELKLFRKEFPKSHYGVDVAYMLDAVIGRLTRHELYVARYYLKEDNYEAALGRINFALKAYPESSLVPEAMVLKGETLMKMKKPDDARTVFAEVISKYGGPFSVAAKNFIQELDAGSKARKAPPPPAGASK